jgi:putative tryptophan/tyrosine transport system substrate-binding protein
MRRREFIAVLGGAAAAWPLASQAQQGDRIRRIGMLTLFAEKDPLSRSRITAFQRGLERLGWTVQRERQSEWLRSQLPAFALSMTI